MASGWHKAKMVRKSPIGRSASYLAVNKISANYDRVLTDVDGGSYLYSKNASILDEPPYERKLIKILSDNTQTRVCDKSGVLLLFFPKFPTNILAKQIKEGRIYVY